MIRRASASDATAPVASICMAMLPSAVASAGPAITVRPVASAVNWLSSRFFDPPPMMRISSNRIPVNSSRDSSTFRYLNARLSRIALVYAGGVDGAGCSVRLQYPAMADSMSSGFRKSR